MRCPLTICDVAEEPRQQPVDRHPTLTSSFCIATAGRPASLACHHQSVSSDTWAGTIGRADLIECFASHRHNNPTYARPPVHPPARQPARRHAPLPSTLPLPLALGNSQCGNPRSSRLTSQDPYSPLTQQHPIAQESTDTQTSHSFRFPKIKYGEGPPVARRTGHLKGPECLNGVADRAHRHRVWAQRAPRG